MSKPIPPPAVKRNRDTLTRVELLMHKSTMEALERITERFGGPRKNKSHAIRRAIHLLDRSKPTKSKVERPPGEGLGE